VIGPDRTVAVVLAAGTSSRFGSSKLLADLAGRPVLAHVLDAAAAVGPLGVVLVLGRDAEAVEAVVAGSAAADARVAVNRAPEEGMAGSLRVGLAEAAERFPDAAAAVIFLGDQPLVRPQVVRALLAPSWCPATTPAAGPTRCWSGATPGASPTRPAATVAWAPSWPLAPMSSRKSR
jgi:molybdenum cofactor cytidylyltransferase